MTEKKSTKKGKMRTSLLFLSAVYKMFEVDRKIHYYGTDVELFLAEIHMIKAIKEHEGIHVTGLAELLGITKGAVSQTIMKLQRKGMIIKERDPSNKSRLALKLSPKGEVAHLHHEKLHKDFDSFIKRILKDATEEQKEFLNEFLASLNERLNEYDVRKVREPRSRAQDRSRPAAFWTDWDRKSPR